MQSSDDVFYQNLYGSGAANAASVVLFLIGWFLKNKCKHSRCGAKLACCFIEINDDSSEEEKCPEKREHVAQEVEICVREV